MGYTLLPTQYRRPSEVEARLIDVIITSNAFDAFNGRAYRKSFLQFRTKRTELCYSGKDIYDCIYKFDIHSGYDPDVLAMEAGKLGKLTSWPITSELVSLYRQRIPANLAADDSGGILLIVVVQWDVPHPTHTKVDAMHLGTVDRAFFVPESSSRHLGSALVDILSPILRDLGILSVHHNLSITSQLVSSAISVHCKTKEEKGPWVPLVVKIVIERTEAEPKPECVDEYFLWGIRDQKRFISGLELIKNTKTLSELEAEDCCAICLNAFQVDCEVVRMPTCSHIYHPNCILEWLIKKKFNCPSCRISASQKALWRPSFKLLFLE